MRGPVSEKPLAVKVLNLCFLPVVNFLIKTIYGTHGISNWILDKVMFLKVFVSLNWFFFQWSISFIQEMLKCLVFCMCHIGIYISQSYYLFAHDSCNGLKFSIRKCFLYSTVTSLQSIVFCLHWENLVAYVPVYLFGACAYYWVIKSF